MHVFKKVSVNGWGGGALRLLHLLLLLLICIMKTTCQYVKDDNKKNNEFYTAGVVEFRPTLSGMSSADLLAEHLKAYLEIITSPEAEDIDIMVFPEGSLNNAFQLTYVPSEKQNVIPCSSNASEYAEFLIKLSCAARDVHKYLVINLSEKEDCPSPAEDPRPCATNGLNVYNTNVVFDREGRVISRYRKVNIYVENKNTTLEPEYAMFDTDFGVRFGHFICFDMLFYTPAQELVNRFGIKDFIFTSLFYSELPFLTATQLQHGWAWGNNVNLLAAGASYPKSGTTGTGIYAGSEGALVTVMVTSGEGERKLYKAQVPKKGMHDFSSTTEKEKVEQPILHLLQEEKKPNHSTGRHLDGIRLLKDPQIQNFDSLLLEAGKHIRKKICEIDFCCEFVVDTVAVDVPSNSSVYKYRMGMFSGSRTYEKDQRNEIKVCAVYACRNEDPESCGELLDGEFQSDIYFSYLFIEGKFPKAPKLLIMPSTLDADLNQLSRDEAQWKYSPQNVHIDVDIWLNGERRDLMTFGIYANYYSSAVVTEVMNRLMMLCVGAGVLYYKMFENI
ncbi:vanin-like protein 2 isoform X2 [Musca autumnalis]|uniref:vanin-like protein 2 isoform X2 n=1 Tax=Musca autumnalis TaxID=221902 RepID=UPI003CF559FC